MARLYLDNIRGAIPLAEAQLDTLLRLVRAATPQLNRFLDLGCGDGVLGAALLGSWPQAHGVFLDFSEEMLAEARRKLDGLQLENPPVILMQDYGESGWVSSIEPFGPFDLVVSGFSIHHQPDERKREIYAEIFEVIRPGGLFLNVEHVSSSSPWIEGVHDELFIDHLTEFQRRKNPAIDRDRIAHDYYHRDDKVENILAPVEMQCEWLRKIGFQDVDCFLKIFELAVFGGRVPKED